MIPEPSEELRLKLLEEERKLRAKQPEHWAKSKYRKYATKMTAEEKELLRLAEKKKKVSAKKRNLSLTTKVASKTKTKAKKNKQAKSKIN